MGIIGKTQRFLPGSSLCGHRSPLLVTLVATAAWALTLLLIARARYGGDVRAFLCVGDQRQLPPAFASIPTAGPEGYDGQMYAALATDPLLLRLNTPNDLDEPAYRATRIMVPALAWSLALGDAPAAIAWYQLLCWGLAVGAVYLLARWLADDQRSPWWALAAAAGAGMAAVAVRSTTDAAALCFILAALLLHARGRPGPALAFAAIAVLTRETSVVAALAIAFVELRRRNLLLAGAFATVPLAAAAAWQAYLFHVLGDVFRGGDGQFSLPFAWLPHKLALSLSGGVWWEEVWGTLAVLATTAALLAVAVRPAKLDGPELTFLAFGGIGLFFSQFLYAEAWAYGRTLIPVPFLAIAIGERQVSGWRRWLLRSVGLLYAVAGLTMMAGEVSEALGQRSLIAALRQGPIDARNGPLRRAVPLPRTPAPPLWALPVAHSGGRAGAVWRTHLEIENRTEAANSVILELYSRTTEGGEPLRAAVVFEPRQRREWRDAVGELLGCSCSGALRLLPDAGPVSARSLTSNVKAAAPEGPLIPALAEDRAIRYGRRAGFRGLASNPVPSAGVRTNIGVVNLTSAPITIRVEAFDGRRRSLGHVSGRLEAHGFAQVFDVFARVRAPELSDGQAEVYTSTPGGAFLAYASVIRGAGAAAIHLYPEPLPAGASTREADPAPWPRTEGPRPSSH